MIVVDIGCCSWGEDRSIDRLIRRFHPGVLYGFDPYPEVEEGTYVQNETKVVIERKAAWIWDGVLSFDPLGSRTHIVRKNHYSFEAVCFDLAAWLFDQSEPVVVKLDCEGAEKALIPYLSARDAFSQISLLLIEFHDDRTRPPIPVPWEPWA